MTLQSNSEQRQKQAIGKFIDAAIVPLLKNRLKFPASRDFIHHACGIFDTNAFKIVNGADENGRALLPLAGMMVHNCTPNTDHWFVDGKCIVRASVDIRAGSPVTNSYTSCLLGTMSRQKHLVLTKLFTCTCTRCQDPTELGSNISSIRCRSCQPGLMIPQNNSSESEGWKCNHCDASLPQRLVETMLRAASSTLELEDYENIVHRLEIVQKLVGLQHYAAIQYMTTLARVFTRKNSEG